MSMINYASREINCKLVYYGPGLGGKTTNLEHIYGKVSPNTRGKMISLATETERTLFFDFLPVDLGTIRGFKTRFHLYTVPGQVYYNASRKLILHALDLAVADEHDSVHAFEDQLAARVVIHLARHGVEVKPRLEPADRAEIDGEEVEEQRALGFGGERDHLAPGVGGDLAVDVLQVGRLAAQAGTVVDELAVDLAGRVVDHRHGRVPLPEEFVNFVFRALEQPFLRRGRSPPCAHAVEHLLEHLGQGLHDALPLELHETERGALIEQDDQDDALRHVGEEHRFLLPLVNKEGEFVLADHLGERIVRVDVGRRAGS